MHKCFLSNNFMLLYHISSNTRNEILFTSKSSRLKGNLGHFLRRSLKNKKNPPQFKKTFSYFPRKSFPYILEMEFSGTKIKNFLIFSQEKRFLYFRKRNFLAQRLKAFLYFLKNKVSYILENGTFWPED